MADEDYKGRSGAASYSARKTSSKKASKSTPSGPRGGDRAGGGGGSRDDRATGKFTGGKQTGKTAKTYKKEQRQAQERKELKKEDKKQQLQKKTKKTAVIKEDKDLGSISKLKEEYEKYKKGDYDGDPFAKTKKEWEQEGMVLPGEHKLRTQYNRLLAKKGPGWAQTTQAKELLGYLAGVPTEKGGFLGGRDPEYGGGRAEYDTHGVFITEERRKELEAERQRLLDDIMAGGNIGELLANVTREGTGADLTSDQFYNFTQQLMAADPSYGNLAYKKERPWSSGAGIPAIGKALISPYTTAATGILGSLSGDKKTYGVGTGADIDPYLFPAADKSVGFDNPYPAEGEELSFPIYGQKERRPEYTGEALDPALLRALRERGGILDPFAREEGGQELAYDGGGGITTLPVDETPGTTPPGTPPGDQWATASPGKIGYYNPETGQYEYGTMGQYLPFAQARDGGIIGLDGGGYLDDYRAADSLMFKDPQEDEEWEYNV